MGSPEEMPGSRGGESGFRVGGPWLCSVEGKFGTQWSKGGTLGGTEGLHDPEWRPCITPHAPRRLGQGVSGQFYRLRDSLTVIQDMGHSRRTGARSERLAAGQ